MAFPTDENCEKGQIEVSAEEGYIAGGSDLNLESTTTPIVSCAWILQAQTGHRINITMINFNYKGLKGYQYGYQPHGQSGITCTDVAVVSDGDTKQNIRLCEDQPRETQVYLSTSDSIKLQMIHRSASSMLETFDGPFLLHYKSKLCLSYVIFKRELAVSVCFIH